ncbi:hypothetical protein O1M54_19840 [Streptomyces diastatochromogenes]|nr:hypothetical protein [Streptomyces diastatochromogenes]
MSLVELIAQADERGLAASGLACLDRCVPLLGGDDEVLRPMWASIADGSEWTAGLEKARGALGPAQAGEDEAEHLAHRMLDAAPAERTAEAIRAWADACSVASLRIHRLSTRPRATARRPTAWRPGASGVAADASPLVAAELRRQVVVLELLAEHGTNGLRRALDVSVEGRRVLQAVVSCRARSRG